MAKNEQVLILEPSNELRFRGPFTEVITDTLKLSNPSAKRVCFKVKTTAPKRYCVRPNSGIIEPSSSVEVCVMLQPFEYDPTEKNKHKFMVQTMFAPDGKIDSLEQLWKEALPDVLMDSKLKCVFEVPVDSHQNSVDVPEEKIKPVLKQEQHSPKVQSMDAETELRKLKDDLRFVSKERDQLRNENSNFKEESIRLRKVAISDTVQSTPLDGGMQAQVSPAIPHFVYLIAAAILGLIVGKFIL